MSIRYAGPDACVSGAQRLMSASVANPSISCSSSSVKSIRSSARDVLLELLDAADADERRGHARVAQRPGERELRQRLAAASRDLRQASDLRPGLLVQLVRGERAVLARARAFGNPVEVPLAEQALRERRERDAAHALRLEHVEQAVLDPAVQHRVRRLVDQRPRAEVTQHLGRGRSLLWRVRGDAGVERLALTHRRVERAHRLLDRSVGIGTMRVEDVDVLETHPPQALVEACEHVLARAPFAVRARPHVVARLRRDDDLVAERTEVLLEEPPEVLLGRAVGRPVVVREVEVRDPEVERAPEDGAARLERPVVAEVLPEAERDGRQQQPAAARSVVAHAVVPLGRRRVLVAPHRSTLEPPTIRSPPSASRTSAFPLPS